jgi:hypothetical protein
VTTTGAASSGASSAPAARQSALWLHDRRRATKPLPSQDTAVIDGGLRHRPLDASDQQRALRLLVWLRDRHWWLSCGCRADDTVEERPPIWFPVARHGTYFLSRPGSAPHAPTCPRRHADQSAPLSAPPSGPQPLRPWHGGWLIHPQPLGACRPARNPTFGHARNRRRFLRWVDSC